MLTSIALENFKIFSNVEVNPNQITVLTGPNSSGKSTIIQALMLLKQTKHDSSLVLTGPYINMGSPIDIAHSPGKLTNIGFSGEEVVKNQNFLDKGRSEEVFFRVKAGFSAHNLMNLQSEIFPEREFMEGEFRNRGRVGSGGSVAWENGRILIEPQLDLYRPFNTTGSSGISTAQEVARGSEYTNYMCSAPQRMFESMEFIPSNRGFSLPEYTLGDNLIDHFEITKPMHDYERDMATTMAYRRDELEEKVSAWMSEITGIRVKFPVRKGRQVHILARRAKVKEPKDIKIAFEGFGSNQLLFILIPLAQSLDNSILLMEEPELHLHPKAQASLTNILLRECKEHSKQIILTTHSEHIIASILTGVADNMISTDDVAIYYLSRRGSSANAKLLKIDSQGRVKGGLPGFFDANIEEAERHIKALERKR